MIKEWFMAWFTPKWNHFHAMFEDDVLYSESWGPEYQGVSEIRQWFTKWHTHSECLTWDIKRFYHTENATIVEWYLCCKDHESKHEFDGCSIIEWGKHNKIATLREYSSTLPKYQP